MGRTLLIGFTWLTIVVAVVLPIVFRSKSWLRALSLAVLVAWAAFVWLGVETTALVAPEIARRDGAVVNDDFNRGARTARDAAWVYTPLFWGVITGLSLLVVVPSKARQ